MIDSARHPVLLIVESVTGPESGQWRFMLQSLRDGQSWEASGAERWRDARRLALLAVVRGLESLDEPCRVTLVTSSSYVQRGLQFGLREWRQNGWRRERYGAMEATPDADLWRRIEQALRFHRIACRRLRFPFPADGETGRHAGPTRDSSARPEPAESAPSRRIIAHARMRRRPAPARTTVSRLIAAVLGWAPGASVAGA